MKPTPKWLRLPAWNMPSDPVRAVTWFLYWILQVLVRYFFVLLLAGVAYETYLNGLVGFAGTLLVGLFVWAGLGLLLLALRITTGISRVYSEVNRLRQNTTPFGFSDFTAPSTQPEEENIVEGSIITDLDEERKRRRQEM